MTEKEITVKMQKTINGHKSFDLVKWCLDKPDDYTFLPRMIPTKPARREEALEEMQLKVDVLNRREAIKSFGFYLDTDVYLPRDKMFEILRGFYRLHEKNTVSKI